MAHVAEFLLYQQEVMKLRSQGEKYKHQLRKAQVGSSGIGGRPASAMKENLKPLGGQGTCILVGQQIL